MTCFIGLFLSLLPILTISDASFRIVGGDFIDITKVPYQVFILNNANKKFCGGSIINKTTILTAAHCFGNNASPKDLTVRVGSNDHHRRGTPNCIPKKIIEHPSYDRSHLAGNDIALLILENELEYTSKVQPVNLPQKGSVVKMGTKGIVAGWGYTDRDSHKQSRLLKYAELETLSERKCRRANRKHKSPRYSYFCAVGANGSNDATLNGDSGGGYVTEDNTVIGLVSYGLKNISTVFTNVAYYLDFVTANSQ